MVTPNPGPTSTHVIAHVCLYVVAARSRKHLNTFRFCIDSLPIVFAHHNTVLNYKTKSSFVALFLVVAYAPATTTYDDDAYHY